MTHDELNQFILNYLTEDKTKSAIMLTGDWGTGKSHYIVNNLAPFLMKEENGSHKCIIVSLYGLKDTLEISRAIYLECRAKFLNADSEKAATGMFLGKTVFKGVTSFLGIDLFKSEDEMRQLYESINLSGKLIILEDLERSGINILEVLGYVNNLVEQDGAKVLLVANEGEIIIKEPKRVKDNKGKDVLQLVNTEQTEIYLKIKEKTVSDTIQYREDYTKAIIDIISVFDNDILCRFASIESAKDIVDIMYICDSLNLRSFIFACQKTGDIFSEIGEKYTSNDDFIRALFYGILFYVLRVKKGSELHWGRESLLSIKLGHEKAPLFRFCYDYLTRQVLDISKVQETFDAYKELLLFDKSKSNTDEDINVISRYYIHTENEVREALKRIENRLENPDDISFYMYGTIAVYAISIKELLDYNIDEITNLLVQNLYGKGDKLDIDHICHTLMGDNASENAKKEYQEIYSRMDESLKGIQKPFANFNYLPEQSEFFYEYVIQNKKYFQEIEGFAQYLDIDRLAEMYLKCSSVQKDNIRVAFITVYRFRNNLRSFPRDWENLRKLLEIIKIQRANDVGDKIQQLQYDLFIGNLTDALDIIK